MARRSRATAKGKAHSFGGDWTSTKLNVLAKYLAAYTTALKDKPSPGLAFRKAYIDAFAGTGYRTARRERDEDASSGTLPFPDLAAGDPQQLLDGSARLALKVEPRFDRYIFIERDAKRCGALEGLQTEFPDLAANILIEQGEANAEIQKLCAKDWSGHRAVLFLDPYGMQVEWQTIEAVAKTKAIDLWLLFPLGIGPETETLRTIAPGVVWVAALLASMLSLGRIFGNDYQDGTLEQLLLTPQPATG